MKTGLDHSPRSHLALSVLSSGALYWVVDLSRSGRTTVDWIVIGLAIAAILWNLIRLGRRLYRGGGAKGVWHLARTGIFWVIGLFNTVLIRPEDAGTWKHWLGWAFLVLAIADTVMLGVMERRLIAGQPHDRPEHGT